MGSDQYCLKWNNHWTNLIRVFNSLLQSETFVDVTLACEGRHLKAHRLVLSACSPYFKELLVAHPDKHPIVILKDVRYSELRTLIEFIYNGEVSVEQHDLAALLCTARELQIKGLADNRLPGDSSSSSLQPPPPPPPPPPLPYTKESDKSPSASHFTTTTTTTAPSTTASHSATPPAQSNTQSSESPAGPIGSEDRPPPPPPPLLTALHPDLPVSASSLLPALHSRPASRSSSPVPKRQRLSTGGSDEGPEPGETDSENPRPDTPNGHVPLQEQNNSGHITAVAGPSFLSQAENNKEDADRPVPSITKISGGQTNINSGEPRSSANSDDDSNDDRGPMTIQSPEVILEEGEAVAESTGAPSSAPSPTLPPSGLGNTTLPAAAIGGPLTSTGPLPPQVAILQQALALGYHPLQHYFPPGIVEQQPSGISPPKELMHFLDVIKALPPGAARLPLGLGGPGGVGLGLPGMGAAAAAAAAAAASVATSNAGREKGVGGSITCHICAMILPSPHQLEEHIRIHEEEKPYKCEQCGQRYKYQSAFQRHQEQNHTAKLPGEKPFRCDVCGQCFKYHKSFSKHRTNHDALDRIMKCESEEGRQVLKSLQESYLHRLLVNESSKSESETSLTLKEECVDPPPDDEPDRPSTSHPPTSFGAALFHAVNRENGIRKYEEGETEDGELEGEEDDGEEEENKGKFVYCVKCKLTFRDVASFEGHCQGSADCSLDTLREVRVNDGPGLSCPPSIASSPQASPRQSPGFVFVGPPRSPLPASTPLALPSPPATTTPTGGLPPSSAIAFSTATANTTILTPGTGTPPGPNNLSIFKFDARGAIMLPQPHLLTPTDGRVDEERPFKCQFCQKGFKGRENLKLHIRTHTGEKPYNCGVCGKAFGGRSDMNRHLRIHTGEKPYPCKVCGKKFARADYLSKHITTHLGIPFAKPVHSLQQSLQNLENMQNLQNLQKLQNTLSTNSLSTNSLSTNSLSTNSLSTNSLSTISLSTNSLSTNE